MDKKSNVIPFFRFPDPRNAKHDPRILADMDLALEKAFNNPALKQFDKMLTHVINEARTVGDVGFRSSAVTESEPEFYAPEPIPDYCYHTEVHFKQWILDFQFFGSGDPRLRDIGASRFSHALRSNNPMAQQVGVQVEFIKQVWRLASRYFSMNAVVTGEDDSFARIDFTDFKDTRVEVYIRPVEDRG